MFFVFNADSPILFGKAPRRRHAVCVGAGSSERPNRLMIRGRFRAHQTSFGRQQPTSRMASHAASDGSHLQQQPPANPGLRTERGTDGATHAQAASAHKGTTARRRWRATTTSQSTKGVRAARAKAPDLAAGARRAGVGVKRRSPDNMEAAEESGEDNEWAPASKCGRRGTVQVARQGGEYSVAEGGWKGSTITCAALLTLSQPEYPRERNRL